MVKLFDFDDTYVESLGMNPKLKSSTHIQRNQLVLNVDIVRCLSYIINEHKELNIPMHDQTTLLSFVTAHENKMMQHMHENMYLDYKGTLYFQSSIWKLS